MIHEWWGLNGYIKQEAEKLQKELGNVNVYALDLYDGKVADNAQDAGRYMGEVKEDRARAIIQGAIDRAGKKAKIYTIGWCFGGGWSLQASLMAGKQGRGCVMYYGMPESDLAKLKKLNADVLGIFAEKDAWITPAVVATFEKNMKDAGKKITVKSYDADHAFANPSNPKYSKEFAEDAHQRALAFFREHLK
jgi:carboxymethylenebutenolidase